MPGGNVDNCLGGSNVLVGLSVNNSWLPGASFCAMLCPSKGLMVLVTIWMVPECLGAKRTTKGHQFPPLPPLPRTHHRGGYEDYHEWQGRREHYGGRQQGRFYEHAYDAPKGPCHRSSSSRRVRTNRRRSRSRSSSSSSSSRKKELQELRAFKAQAEKDKQSAEQKAEAAAAEQARKKELDELEQRMIRAISAVTPQVPMDAKISQSPKQQPKEEPSASLSPKSCRLLEARTDDLVSLPKDSTWEQVRSQLDKIPKGKIKTLLQRRGLTPLPRSEVKKVDKLFAYLQQQCCAWEEEIWGGLFPAAYHPPLIWWFFVCLLIVAGFVSGSMFGVMFWPSTPSAPFLDAPIQYLRALKTLMWDYRSVSSFLEQSAGIPILGASSATLGFLLSHAVKMSLPFRPATISTNSMQPV